MSKIFTITHDASRIYALSISEPTAINLNTEPIEPSPYTVTEFDSKQEALDWITQEQLTMPEGLRWSDDPLPTLESQLYNIYKHLPIEIRAAFAPAWVVVNSALQLGDVELAQATIAGATVPPEIEPLKAQLLAMLG